MAGADRAYLAVLVLLIVAIGAGVYCLDQRQPFGRDPLVLSDAVDVTSAGLVMVSIEGEDLPGHGRYTLPGDTTLGEARDIILTGSSGVQVEFVLRPSSRTEAGPQLIDLNHADQWLLEALPGIGEQRAAAIVRYREEHGGFQSPEELLFVEGIGPSTYEAVCDLVTVAPLSD